MSRYVLLTEFFPPHHGGIEDTLGRMADALGPELTVVTPQQVGAPIKAYETVPRSLFSGDRRPRWLWLVPWLRARRTTTQLTIFGHYSAAVMAGWVLSFFGQPYAIVVHGHDLLSEQEKRGRQKLVAWHLRRAKWVGINSQFMANQVHVSGVPWSRIVKLHPMIDDEQLMPVTTPSEAHDLITVSRLVRRKNVAAVIEAVAELQSEFPDLRYHVVGDGPERKTLEKLTTQRAVSDRVIFHGQVDESTKWQLLRHATIGVMTPLSAGSEIEGFGLFFLEASAARLPVVAAQSGGVADAVRDGETGLMVPSGDKKDLVPTLRRLLTDSERRSQMAQAGQAFVQREFVASVRLRRLESLVKRQSQSRPPLVSVIIPAFQSATTIADTIDSLLDQTWSNMELFVVDDGSTDNLATVLSQYGSKLNLLRQENQGAAAARNTGARQAKGEFLLFVDADTLLDPDMITTMMVTLQTHPDASFAYSNFKFGPKGFHLFEFDPERLRQQNYIHTTSLIRRKDFPGFDPNLKKFQDWDVWLTMLERGHQGIWIPRQLFSVAQRGAGVRSAHQISSTWLPSFVYRLPLIGQGRGSSTIKKYREAERIIREKHH